MGCGLRRKKERGCPDFPPRWKKFSGRQTKKILEKPKLAQAKEAPIQPFNTRSLIIPKQPKGLRVVLFNRPIPSPWPGFYGLRPRGNPLEGKSLCFTLQPFPMTRVPKRWLFLPHESPRSDQGVSCPPESRNPFYLVVNAFAPQPAATAYRMHLEKTSKSKSGQTICRFCRMASALVDAKILESRI